MARKSAETNLELIRKKFFFASKRPRTQVQYPPKITFRKKKKFEKKKKNRKNFSHFLVLKKFENKVLRQRRDALGGYRPKNTKKPEK